ncbi:MAG: methionine--tRNA ligase [Verrucomicrobia bacterium]|nr:methionine--tRNA ligase [Verrucomicrobiota bacterium]MCG2678686.1 methionine--tRNA ligase [Kiritimatiellia bacterium]MBU4248507.1 methionine--tRNA ligase [Verrucomicrobiota bacterium]MBU4291319.1 methionine--tRNA ligase [Verrucomicrobiota bacterium]MBU4429070.1 methionine--tRNA ligase [Verrucomicrobiota bacterium]
MKPSSFYVTTPIYYVNDSPHIGHAYTTILADVLARYHRLAGVPTFFLTGSDEHGQKVQRAAEKAGITPQEQADRTVVHFQALWKKLGITHDDFIRTTEPRHTRVVRKILQALYDQGEIYKAEYDGWYCVPCERFYTDRDLQAGKCVECGRSLERITESNYFFKMSAYQDWLIRYIHEHPEFIQPDFRRNETLGFLQKPLNDLCISRPKSRLAWGIDLPFDSGFVTYVWFDALVNYISAAGYLDDDARFQRWWPANYHLIGKDILTTHTVYWPTMLKAMGVPMPKTIFAHGWWLIGDSKMSKSAGNVINPIDLADRYGVDAFRYFLLAEMTLGQDCHFSEEAFIRRCNADLANDVGNLLSRITKLVTSYCGGIIPAPGEDTADEPILRQAVLKAVKTMEESLGRMRLDLGLAAVIGAVREANRYLEKRQPWTLAKQTDKRPLGTVLYHAAETLRIVSGLLYPVMPDKMILLRRTLGLPAEAPALDQLSVWGKLPPDTVLGETVILFPRITTAPAEAKPLAAGQVPKTDLVEYADFAKIQLKTARILSAEKVEGADKLLKLQIEIGGETRQIVAGIAQHYAPADLAGKTVVVVANLKPANIRGVESNGMLLAASQGPALRLLTVDGDLPSGAGIK